MGIGRIFNLFADRKKGFVNTVAAVAAALLCCGCWTDKEPDVFLVDGLELHFSCGGLFGVTEDFAIPLSVTMYNSTEQFSYNFLSDNDGSIVIDGVMPGQYSVNIFGSLTPEEAERLGKGTSRYISGYISGLGLHLGVKPESVALELEPAKSNPMIFKELYYAGSPTPNNGTYRNDNFYSIYNNSSESVDISDLYIGLNEHYGRFGEPSPLWPGEENGNYGNVYLKSVWKITGNGSCVVNPGQTVVIASMAAPHNKSTSYNLLSPVDLSSADFEAYVNDPENKYPDFAARNMEMAFWPDYSYLWRCSVFGRGMVLLKASREEFASFERVSLPESFWSAGESEEYYRCVKVPYSYVVDAVDLIQNETVTATKLFNAPIDAGYATVAGIYNSLSVRRKTLSVEEDGREVLMDTNNSTVDFYVNPNPLAE